jgi:prefoldin subunit 5
MFPFSFWYNNSCYGGETVSRKTRLERKLKFLKTMRDDLETKLAGLNAAINNVEQQITQEDVTQV